MAQRLVPQAISCDLGSLPRPIVLSVAADVGLASRPLSVLLLGTLVVEVRVSKESFSQTYSGHVSIYNKILTSASLSQSSSQASGTPPLFMLQNVVVGE